MLTINVKKKSGCWSRPAVEVMFGGSSVDCASGGGKIHPACVEDQCSHQKPC